ncbi:adhesion G protein-coupled receptor E3-like [Stegostoma tigrinum]|uniref:adhesion G protein-coupled receptor E3-like n=1 Tax=Stegostoma tigrinum TaxID=3053191 RepID=UPI002870B396|nr:adhesion G protein-coupled receptor E3-like [Stegostoma tigrinum]
MPYNTMDNDNECEFAVSARCGVNTECHNTFGSFYCTCKKGYSTHSGVTHFTTTTHCRDINECETDPCGSHATCTNTFGGFYCTCNRGFVSTTGGHTFTDKTVTQCKELNRINTKPCSSNNFTKAGQVSLKSFHILCSWINSTIDQITHQNVQVSRDTLSILSGVEYRSRRQHSETISNLSDILRNYSLWENMEKEQRLFSCSTFLKTMENAGIVAALNLSNQGIKTISSESINMELKTFRGANRIHLQVNDTVMDINELTHITGNTTAFKPRIPSTLPGFLDQQFSDNTMRPLPPLFGLLSDFQAQLTMVGLIVYKDMDSILNGSEFHSTTGGNLKPFHLLSDVASAVITNRDNNGLDPTVSIIFKRMQPANNDWAMHCAHWNYEAGTSYWSPSGCSVGRSNGTHTQCRCSQLSTLALLMSPVGWQDYPFALTIITLVGIPISLVCLGITIVTFAFCTNLRNALYITHMQLCVSLFLAELLFIVGINRTRNQVICGIIAGFLHYLFLAAFVWMFLEGVQLFLMVRNIRNLRVPQTEKTEKFMNLLGYGVPAIIVFISAAVYHKGYGSPRHCWISTDGGFIWSFLGPVCLIILINTALYLTILLILKREISKQDTQVSKLQNTRMLTFKAIAQVFLLGCTWIFGLFQFQEEPGAMTYLFTIINSFQGTFIFILLCILNPKVRAAYCNYFTRMCKTMDTVASEEDKTNAMTVLSISKD